MVYVFLAEGFEETEAIVPIDILRRGELEVATVGVTGQVVTSSHGVPVVADVLACEIMPDETCEAVILPGGMPGTLNLEKDKVVRKFIEFAECNGRLIAAICAAPSILGHMGLLEGKKATCFPGFEEQLMGAEYIDESVVRDGNLITAKGAGVAIDFGLEIVKVFAGDMEAKRMRNAMQCAR
jgi:4-methyl-5(b-hydroxyethyl)-thiazole monophosphate biosynthesis